MPSDSNNKPELSISLFGPMEVLIDGAPMPPLRSKPGYWLLALLALREGREVERSWLAGTLWADSTEAQSFSNLRRYLFDLRNAMGAAAECIVSPGPRTLMLRAPGSVDVAVFDAAVSCSEPAELEKAAAAYRGPLLEGCMEEWVLLERETREQAYLGALEKLAGIERQRGNHQAAADHLRKAIVIDPLRESAQRELIQTLAEGGNFGAATLAYRDLRLRLRAELRADVSAETAAVYSTIQARARERLATSEPLPIPPVAHTEEAANRPAPPRIPHPLTQLVGREDEIAEIGSALASSRLVTLLGPGGVGKTRLAIEICTRLEKAFPDGVWFLDLTGVSQPEAVAPALAALLGVETSNGDSVEQTLRNCARSLGALVVMDNCEHLTEACAAVATLFLESSPQSKILATSRHALEIAGETLWRVPSLSLPDAGMSRSDVSHSDAVGLFMQRASAAVPKFELTDENCSAVATICRRLDGMPLAIELAAARLKVLSVAQVAERLDQRLRLLTTGGSARPHRHQTLQATLEWSFNLLEPNERRLLLRLSVFAGRFTLDDAVAVCSEARDETEVLDLISGLVDKSMVSVEEAAEGKAYRLLETTREFAADRLRESGEETELRRRHAERFLDVAENAHAGLHGRSPAAALRQLENARDNVYAALDWLMTLAPASLPAGDELFVQLVASMVGYWNMRGMQSEARLWLQRALARPISRSRARAQILMKTGLLAVDSGDHETAESMFGEARDIYAELADQGGLGSAIIALGRVAHSRGDFPPARELFEEAMQHGLECGRPSLVMSSLFHLGLAAYGNGDYDDAWRFHQEAFEMSEALGDVLDSAWCLGNLADTALAKGEFHTAADMYRRNVAAFQELGYKHGIASGLFGMGRLEVARGLGYPGAAAQAARLFAAADAMFTDMGVVLWPVDREKYERDLALVREHLGPRAFAAAWDSGAGLSVDEVVASTLDRRETASRGSVRRGIHRRNAPLLVRS